jgi:serine-type D-Ala-D-Ala carboxypeptidase/endopeptidase
MHASYRAGLAGVLFASTQAFAMTDAQLQSKLEQRFAGDRTGACVVAAVIDGAQVARAKVCANPQAARSVDFDTAFEIGSITKTMTAFLVADLIAQGKWSLSDPIAKHLPKDTPVPKFNGAEITVAHLVTHTAGLPPLPSRLSEADQDNPYARLRERDLLASLGDARLSTAPGASMLYSNFGMMVLSAAVARAQGGDLEAALKQKLFAPLGMHNAYIRNAPAGTRAAQGHLPNGERTAAWTIETNLAGVGMVRASLNDMIKYAQAQLAADATPLSSRMQMTHVVPKGISPQQVAMNWYMESIKGVQVIMHDGGTGGFSSSLVMDKAGKRAAIVLADTSLTNVGGFSQVSLHVLGLDVPLGKPRIAQSVPEALKKSLAGDFDLEGLPVKFFVRDGKLISQAQGQQEFELGYDSAGDFYPLKFDALIKPQVQAGGKIDRFTFLQGGAVLEAVRVGIARAATAVNPLWVEYAGEYQLAPSFMLRVFEQDGKLKVQGTGQQAIDAVLAAKDKLEIAAVGAVVEFARDAQGAVVQATLVQNGRRTPGKKK